MYDMLKGIRVVELAEYIFVPSAATILADWGAEVIKVERIGGNGDPMRSLPIMQLAGSALNPNFEVSNRGKRGVALDLQHPDAYECFLRLIDDADVFLTSLRAGARAKLRIEPEDLRSRRPDLIYARGSGYGIRGPLAGKGGFDYPSSWCRAGAAFAQTPADGSAPPMQPGSVGDLMSGATLAGAIAAALFRRQRTGEGAIVDNSLYHVGAYIMTQAVATQSIAGTAAQKFSKRGAPSPLVRQYRTSDGRWIVLCLVQHRWWPDLARHLGRDDLASDERFATPDALQANGPALEAELEIAFAARTYAEWCEALDSLEGVWEPVQSPEEVLADEQLWSNGYVKRIAVNGSDYCTVASPCQFDEQDIGDLGPAPSFGQHTEEVLRGLGIAPEVLDRMRADGAIA